jgi:secretion/DNA translocation related CpaE-like protein
MSAPAGSLAARPLVVASDPTLLDDVLRLAAAAGVEIDVAPDLVAARTGWARAPLVLVADDATTRAASGAADGPLRVRRRPDVILVGRDLDDAGIWQRAVDIGADHVALLPDAEPWLLARLARSDHAVTGRVLALIGASGGVGTTSLAVAIAVTNARRRRRTLLVDADPTGGGLDTVFGGRDVPGARWDDLAGWRDAPAARSLARSLPYSGALALLSCGQDRGDDVSAEIPAPAMRAVLDVARRQFDLVVVDLPRRAEPAGDEALAVADLTVLLARNDQVGAAAAARAATTVTARASDVRVVVRAISAGGFAADDLATELGLPLLCTLRTQPSLSRSMAGGELPAERGTGSVARAARRVLDHLDAITADPLASEVEDAGRRGVAEHRGAADDRGIPEPGGEPGWLPA